MSASHVAGWKQQSSYGLWPDVEHVVIVQPFNGADFVVATVVVMVGS